MKRKDQTPKKNGDEKKTSKQTPGSDSSGGKTPYSPNNDGRPYSETRKNIKRADSPDCQNRTTTLDFCSFSDLKKNYEHGNGALFLLRVLR